MIFIESELWVEKYRPSQLNNIYGQEVIINQLKLYVLFKNLPHLLFVGPPGTGKTASSIALAKELYLNFWRDNFLELNASDERGIDTVRTKIKNFSKTAPSGSMSFKLIFLDEADALTNDAQTALRRIMEQFSSNCRFILTCNYINKIIDPIKSRCAIYNFMPLTLDSMINYIKNILKNENKYLPDSFLKLIASSSNGDLRKALITTQTLTLNENHNQENLLNIINHNDFTEDFREIIQLSLNGNFIDSYDKLNKLRQKTGISSIDIINKIYDIVYFLDIENEKLANIISLIADLEYRIINGANESIQLASFIAKLSLLNLENNNCNNNNYFL